MEATPKIPTSRAPFFGRSRDLIQKFNRRKKLREWLGRRSRLPALLQYPMPPRGFSADETFSRGVSDFCMGRPVYSRPGAGERCPPEGGDWTSKRAPLGFGGPDWAVF